MSAGTARSWRHPGAKEQAIHDALNLAPTRYYQIRGRVIEVTTDGAAEHIEKLAQRYLGGPYPWFGGRDQTRVLITIEADKITGIG